MRHNPHLAQKYQIRSVPSFVYLREGEEVRRRSGLYQADEIRRLWSDFGW